MDCQFFLSRCRFFVFLSNIANGFNHWDTIVITIPSPLVKTTARIKYYEITVLCCRYDCVPVVKTTGYILWSEKNIFF